MPGWAIALVVAGGVWIVLIGALALAGRGSQARELVAMLPNLARLFKGLLGDPRVPRHAKIALGIAVVWIASPIDLIPEFLPVIGPLDDAVVAALVLRYVLRRAGPEVIAEHWRGGPGTLELLVGRTRAMG
jgi:uncharacterized membrane protein YkvA (DUF1232 family)